MTTRLSDARNSLIDVIEALTPEFRPTLVYKHKNSRQNRQGSGAASMHRKFFFEPVGGGDIQDMGCDLTIMDHQLALIMYYHDQSAVDTQLLDRLVTDAVQIQLAINTKQDWPAGVDFVRCLRYDLTPGSGDSTEILFSLEATVQEVRS